jgi:hypothetical protein
MVASSVNLNVFNNNELKKAFFVALSNVNPNFLEKPWHENAPLLQRKFPSLPTTINETYQAFDGGKMKNVTLYSVNDIDKEYPNLNYYFKTYGTVDNMRKFLASAQVDVNEPLMFFANVGPYKRAAFHASQPQGTIFEVDYNNPGVITTYRDMASWVNYYFA